MAKQILAMWLLSYAVATPKQSEPKQVSYMVWDRPCIQKIEQTEKFYIDAPMVDGKPDLKKAEIHGQVATYEPSCGRIEIRRVR